MTGAMATPSATPAPAPRRIALWFAIPAVMLALIVLFVVAVVVSVNPKAECERAERLIATYSGDPKPLLEAQQRLKLALVTHPFDARAWAVASHIARVSGDPGGGEWDPKNLKLVHDLARKALRADAHSPDAQLAEGWAYACEADWANADACARRASAVAPDDPRVRVLDGAVAQAMHRMAEAITHFGSAATSAAADSATRADALVRLGEVQASVGDDARADSCFGAAIALVPLAAWPREAYVRFLGEHGRFEDEVAAAEALVTLANNAFNRSLLADAHVDRGVQALDARHDYEAALRDFDAARADLDDDAALWFDTALAHFGLWRRDAAPAELAAARDAIARARKLAPGDADIQALEARIASENAGPR